MEFFAGKSCDRAAGAGGFAREFQALTGHSPFHWQERLFARFLDGDVPTVLDLPTGLGKTSVIAIWLLARAANPTLPRRLVYVVDRRVVVDQATAEAEKLRRALKEAPELAGARAALGFAAGEALPVSTLRGRFADNREWLADPSRPAIIVGTIDMIGSRLLFEGYGVGRKMRPYHAGLLGADTLVVLDEAHLCPPFQALLQGVADYDSLKPRGETRRMVVPGFRLLPLSATGRASDGNAFRLEPEDHNPTLQPMVHQRYTAGKRLALRDLEPGTALPEALAERAWALGEGNNRVLVFCDTYGTALKVETALRKRCAGAPDCALDVLVGKRRVRERETLVDNLTEHGFLHPAEGERPARDGPAFLVATSAGEVGIDIDADHIVCDLVAYERMVQRLGRVNRRGGDRRAALIEVVCPVPEPPKADAKDDEKTRRAEARADLLAATRALLNELPPGEDGRRDASPRALAELKERLGAERIEAATTPAPLRPALDRAVVDAWSLTSLPEHPGRPEPEPWLRGWVEEDEPATQVLWRAWLPWRVRAAQPQKLEVESLFDAARPLAPEILEAPVRQVAETLIARAAAVVEQRKATASDDDGEASPKQPTTDGIIALTRARELRGARTLNELAALAGGGKRDVQDLERLLVDGIVVVSASLGGVNKHGLLDREAGGPGEDAWPGCLDAGWEPEDIRIRLRPPGATAEDKDWPEAYRFALANGEDDEPPVLVVEVWRGSGAQQAGDPAISRRAQSLAEHGAWAECEAGRLADTLKLAPEYKATLEAAARVHDLGKARDLWQNAMRAPRDGRRPYAKTTGASDPARLRIGPHTYRHEFGSLRDVEAEPALLAGVPEELRDLALHLIAAHHGYARPLIAPVDPLATPAESEARAAAAALRFARLQRDWGPWGLAWWEALLRAADWAASTRNDRAGEAAKDVAGAAGGTSAAGPLLAAKEPA